MCTTGNLTVVISQKARHGAGWRLPGNTLVKGAHPIKYLAQVSCGWMLVQLD
jgi:hypothetical protein